MAFLTLNVLSDSQGLAQWLLKAPDMQQRSFDCPNGVDSPESGDVFNEQNHDNVYQLEIFLTSTNISWL